MPHVVNGVGTWYYGKKNAKARQGVCQQCQQAATLTSYDTRLWFVILFIPIIPLGRKRVMDECSRCQRHYAADRDKYEMSKQLSISGAQDNFRESPTPENAMQVHAQFLGFHQHEEAQRFREAVLEQFPQSADLRACLASHLEQMGDWGGAFALHEQAHALRPDLPDARVGVARKRMGENQLDEARQLLDFLEEPGAGQLHSLEALDQLAGAYQAANRHQEALDLCKVLIREYPNVAEHHQFRKFVLKSEKAVDAPESILPQVGFSLRGLFDSKSGRYASGARWLVFGSVALVLAALGTVGLSEYRKGHRDVRVINLWNEPVSISIDGGPAMPQPNFSHIEVSEGTHHVAVSGAITDEFDITLESGFFQRLFKSPVWCINPGGAAALQVSTVHYAVAPRPSEVSYSIGERFIYVPDVDYVFTPPPQTLKVDKKGGEVTKVAVELCNEPAVSLYRHIAHTENVADAERFAQARIRMEPQRMELMSAYVQVADTNPASLKNAIQFFESGLWKTPLSVNWHRCYSALLEKERSDAEAVLVKLYDGRLEQTPNDANLLYLRGRVSETHSEANRFFEMSAKADKQLAWPYLGLSWLPVCNGDWQAADTMMDQAIALGLQDDTLHGNRHFVLLGLKKFQPLEESYRSKLSSQDTYGNIEALINLCDVLVSQGRADDARQALNAQLSKIPPEVRRPEVTQFLERPIKYMLGEFAATEPPVGAAAFPMNDWDLHEWLQTGRAQQLTGDARFATLLKETWNQLALSNALYVAGDRTAAEHWRDEACTSLEKSGSDEKRAAALLRGKNPATEDAIRDVALSPRIKVQVMAALCWLDPERKEQHASAARRLNVSRIPPYHLVEAVIAKAP